ncbi:MAG: caspase family protein [Muribaculaceae bacterium]|nr:caspase family protein [Muribaculaceae bacterium]
MKIFIPHLFYILGLLLIISSPQAVLSARHALLVGIGRYDTQKTGWRKIHGDADVNLLSPLLQKRGFKVQTLVNSQATKKNIADALNTLAKECRKGDEVYFQFSGHGQRVKDLNGDETDGIDEAIVCYDALRTPGYATPPTIYKGENHLLDDELAPLFQKIRKAVGPEGCLFITFDACYSRGLEKGGEEDEEIDYDQPLFVRGTDELFIPSDNSYLLTIPPPGVFEAGCPTSVVSACLETERNFEVKIGGNHYGVLSWCISLLLRDNFDFTAWTNYFRSGAYNRSGIFRPYQHPSIIIYK